MSEKIVWILLFLTCSSGIPAQVNDFDYLIEKQKVNSKHLDEEHHFNIYLPIGYHESQQKYPVLYVLESVYHFTKSINAVHGLGKLSPQIPEMIIVGLNTSDRWRDLTPSNTEDWMGYPIPQSGNGMNYLAFIETEIIPLIDSSYRTQPFRVIYGHSLGGLYTLYTLAEKPDLFKGFIASSPNLEYDNRIVNRKLEALLQKPLKDRKFIFMCGDNDSDDYIPESKYFAQIVDSLSGEIDHTFRNYENENHWEVPDESIVDGLKYVFKDFTLPDTIIGKGAVEIKRFYDNTSSAYGYVVKPMGGFMNHLGYMELNQGRIEEAIEFFKYNVELYPDDPNVYDSLGEGFLKLGNKEEARKNYEMSLKLNPGNENARKVLDELKE